MLIIVNYLLHGCLDIQAKESIVVEAQNAAIREGDFSFERSSGVFFDSCKNSDMDRTDSGTLVRKKSDENLKNAEKRTVLGFTTPLS